MCSVSIHHILSGKYNSRKWFGKKVFVSDPHEIFKLNSSLTANAMLKEVNRISQAEDNTFMKYYQQTFPTSASNVTFPPGFCHP